MICQCKDEDCTCYGECQANTALEVTDHFFDGAPWSEKPTTTPLCERCILHGIQSRIDESDSSLEAAFYESNYPYNRKNADQVRNALRFAPDKYTNLSLVQVINCVLA